MTKATSAAVSELPPSASQPPAGESSTQDYLPSLPPLRTLLNEVPLSRDLKRRLLALIVQANLLDCLDESGAFDHKLFAQVLPACAVQSYFYEEITRTDRHGTTTVRRKVRLRLANKLTALRLDDQLERQEEREKEKEGATKALSPPLKPQSPLSSLREGELVESLPLSDEERRARNAEDREYRRREALQRAKEIAARSVRSPLSTSLTDTTAHSAADPPPPRPPP